MCRHFAEPPQSGPVNPFRPSCSYLHHKRIGQLLVEQDAVRGESLQDAIEEQRSRGDLLGRVLVRMGACGGQDIADVLRKQFRFTTVDPSAIALEEEALSLLDEAFCRRWKLVPFELLPGSLLCVAMVNVISKKAWTAVEEQSGCTIKAFAASAESVSAALERAYGHGS